MIRKKIRIAFVLTSVLGFSCMGWNAPFGFTPRYTLAGLFDFGKQEVPVDPFLAVESPLDSAPTTNTVPTTSYASAAYGGTTQNTQTTQNATTTQAVYPGYSATTGSVQPVAGTVNAQSLHTATAAGSTVSHGAANTSGVGTAVMTGMTGAYSVDSPVVTTDRFGANRFDDSRFAETALPVTEPVRFADARFSRAEESEMVPVAPMEPMEMANSPTNVTSQGETSHQETTPPPVPATLQSSVSDGNPDPAEETPSWSRPRIFRKPAFLGQPLTPPWKSTPSISEAEREKFASDPLSPTRIGQSPYGDPSDYARHSTMNSEQRYFLAKYFGAVNPSDSTSPALKSRDARSASEVALDDSSTVGTPSGAQLLDDFDTSDEWKSPWDRLTSLFAVAPDHDKARATYEKGMSLFREKKYKESARAFREASALWPDSAIQEDALFMRAESFFFADQYKAAYDEYCYLFKYYEFSRYTDVVSRRMFMIAQYWEKYSRQHPEWTLTPNLFDGTRPTFDTRGYAVKCYGSVRTYDPIGPLGDDAIMAAAGIYFADEKWVDAAREYKQLRTDYSQSEYLMKAHVLEVQSLCYQYQGLQYEITPLREAGKLIDQSLIRFGDELGEERDGLITTKREIVQSLARREYEIGKYYDSKGYYRAARIYYESILMEYPATDVATEAKQRLEEIRKYPDTPTDYLAWVEEIFPQRK
ncbi:MAG: hypothetical protein PHE53_01660 [Thermoguttaceae bacterium]|nr:hypothetical protein [Thermoguttaceae bacterium]